MEKAYILNFIAGFITGTSVAAGIAVLIYLRKLGRYRRENGSLRASLELCNREVEQYGSQISAIRRDLEGCKSELTTGLDSIAGIRDASKAIRRQVEVLEKYVRDTGVVYGNLSRNVDTGSKKQIKE